MDGRLLWIMYDDEIRVRTRDVGCSSTISRSKERLEAENTCLHLQQMCDDDLQQSTDEDGSVKRVSDGQ